MERDNNLIREEVDAAGQSHVGEQENAAGRTHAGEQEEVAGPSHAQVKAIDQDNYLNYYHKTINTANAIVEKFLNGERPVFDTEVNDDHDILNFAILEAFLETVRTRPSISTYIPEYLSEVFKEEVTDKIQQEIDKSFFDYALLEDHCLKYNQLNYLHENRSIKKYLVNYNLLKEQGKMFPGFIKFLDAIEESFKTVYDDVEPQYPNKKRIDRQYGIECKKFSLLRDYALAKINSASDMLTVYTIYGSDSKIFLTGLMTTLVCGGNSFNYNNERAYMEQETKNLLYMHSNMCMYLDDYTKFEEMDMNLFPVEMLDIIQNLGYLILWLLEEGWKPEEWKPRLQESFFRSFLRHLTKSSWMQYNYFSHYLELNLIKQKPPTVSEISETVGGQTRVTDEAEDEGKDKDNMPLVLDLLKKERKALRVYGSVLRINPTWELYLPDMFKDRVLKAVKTIEDFAIIQEQYLNGLHGSKRTEKLKLKNPLLEFGLDVNLLPGPQSNPHADTAEKKDDEKTSDAGVYVLPNMNELDNGEKWKQIHIDMTQDYMNMRPNYYRYSGKDYVTDSSKVDTPKVSAINPIKKIFKKLNAVLNYRDNFIKPAPPVVPVEPKPKPKPTAKQLTDASKAKFNKKGKTAGRVNISDLPEEDYEDGLPIRIDFSVAEMEAQFFDFYEKAKGHPVEFFRRNSLC